MKILLIPLRAILRQLAVMKLWREKPTIIAITGSVGKTTTKEAIFSVLLHHFSGRVRKSAGNMNTEEGVPLTILGFDFVPTRWQYPFVVLSALVRAFSGRAAAQSILVQELAAEKPGDIDYLTSILKPWLKVGVVTTVGPIHLNSGQFTSPSDIAAEKGRLVEALPPSGWAVLNRDNRFTRSMAKRTPATVVWFSDKGVESAKEIARAVGKLMGVPPKEADLALKTFTPPYGRLNELTGLKGSTVIDDSYNANPMSVEQAIEYLARCAGRPFDTSQGDSERQSKSRRIAVFGDMLELGTDERIYHQQIGKLANAKLDVVVGVGRRARWYQPTYWFATPLEAAHFLKKFIQAGDTILVKGSQSMRMEMVSEALLADPALAAKLPRQTPAWKGKPFVQP